MQLIKFPLLAVLYLGFIFHSVNGQVRVFDVGQGNCVAVRHNNKVILVDAGSTESDYRALYSSRSNKEEEVFVLFEMEDRKMGEVGSSPARYHSDQGSQSTSSSPESIKGKATSDAKSQYGNDIIKNIQDFVGEDDPEIVIVLSHSDNDHINWIPKIFNNERLISRITHVILGGFSEDYLTKDSIKGWLQLESLRGKLIYTGTYKGEAGYPGEDVTNWGQNLLNDGKVKYARPYWSFLQDKTEAEQTIERALQFGEDGPQVQILSMNGGHALMGKDHNLVTALNEDSNANSIVLRFQGRKSFVVPGDAESATWNHMHAMYRDHTAHNGALDLKADYFLLSHHGSKSKGSTTQNILDFFNPSFIIVSAGHVEHHHHPSGSAIDISFFHLKERGFKTQPHYVTYYKTIMNGTQKTYLYNRRFTRWPLFSTITNGILAFNLVPSGEQEEINITSFRQKQPFFESHEGKQFIADKVWKFLNRAELDLYIGKIKDEKDLVLWKEDMPQSSRTRHGLKSRTYVIEPIQTMETGTAVGEASSAVPREIQNLVVRHKAEVGKPEQWILYSVKPVQAEEEPDSIGDASSSST